jgi:predicted Zn finger-like uncharacterized protein
VTIGCPSCRRTFRLDDARFRPGARMRCSRCGHLFVPVEPQPAAPGPPAEASPAPSRPPVAPVPAPAGPARPQAKEATGDAPLAILADAGRPFRDRIRPVLEALGCRVMTAEEGAEAFRAVVARKPAIVVASVHLPGLSGVAICEGVKGSPHLKAIKVALVGSDLSADLFNRDTALAYGADLFLEEGMGADLLRSGLGGLLGGASPEVSEAGDLDDPLAALTSAAPAGGAVSDEIRRLARIMLSDLRLYNPDRFGAAVRENRVLETFKAELARGRDLVDRRFPAVPTRLDVLAAALREGIERERVTPPDQTI